MQTAQTASRAFVRVALAESASLLWPWGCVAVATVVALCAATEYLSPPFWFAERGELAATQATAAIYVAVVSLVLGWVWVRHRGHRSMWLARVDPRSAVICAEALGISLAISLVAISAGGLLDTLNRTPASERGGADGAVMHGATIASAMLGLAALAPGLARLPTARTLLVPVFAVIVAGDLGFLGPAFPLRAGRLWGPRDPDTWAVAPQFTPDVMVALAGLFVSFGLGRRVRRGS